jgi:histidinol-phosphatase (PHP family)
MLTDYHMHTPLCRHAEGWPLELATQARALGLAEIGFSDHNPMPETLDDWRMDLSELPAYIAEVERARAALPGYPIRLSLECDYLAGQERWLEKTAALAPWDYLIGSVHYIAPGVAIDDPRNRDLWCAESEIEAVWQTYWQLYVQMVRTGLCDFYAHPDLAKRFGHRPKGDLRRYYEPAIQALLDMNSVMEVSTAGLRKDVAEIYPAEEMVRLAHSAGVPIVINSDAHRPAEVGSHFDQALQLVRRCGYTQTVRFHQRQRSIHELPQSWPISASTVHPS